MLIRWLIGNVNAPWHQQMCERFPLALIHFFMHPFWFGEGFGHVMGMHSIETLSVSISVSSPTLVFFSFPIIINALQDCCASPRFTFLTLTQTDLRLCHQVCRRFHPQMRDVRRARIMVGISARSSFIYCLRRRRDPVA